MNTAAHTPGPWHLSEETQRDGLRSRLVHGMPEGMLAIVRVEHQGGYYGDANAHLIAAAPDMLAALREARTFMMAPAEDLLWSVIGRLDAAISKAEASL